MDQRAVWVLLRSRWPLILAIALLGPLAGAAYSLLTTPSYTATSELFVATVDSDNSSDLAQGSDYSQQQARNYSVVASRDVVLSPVIKALDLHTSSAQLARQISVTVPLNTSLISIAVSDESPVEAARIANSTASSLNTVVGHLVPKRSDGTSPVRLEVVQSAVVPSHPTSPNTKLAIIVGFVIALLLGTALVLLRELAGAKVRTPEQLRQLFAFPDLGKVVYDRGTSQHTVAEVASGSLRAESYRQIRTNLRFLHADLTHKVFVVSSSVPGEGKTTTSINIAATLAAAGSRVVLVEADLRRPTVASYLDLEGTVGLTTVLAGQISLEDALQTWGPDGLHVLLAGQIPPNPSELLASDHAARVFDRLRGQFDVVIIDCPPIAPVTDATLLAALFGGVVLVVGCGRVEVRELRRSAETLSATGSPVLGTISNFAPQTRKERYLGAYGAYAQPSPKETGKRKTKKTKTAAATRDAAAEPVSFESLIRGQ